MRPVLRIHAIAGIAAAACHIFPADTLAASLNPVYKTNVRTIEIHRERFAYELVRLGRDRRFRVEFAPTRAVPAPPVSWGS